MDASLNLSSSMVLSPFEGLCIFHGGLAEMWEQSDLKEHLLCWDFNEYVAEHSPAVSLERKITRVC